MKINIEKAIESFRINFGLIKRDGAEELLKWIESETDFYTAPASAANHLACGSGLLVHSLNVRNNLDQLNHRLNLGFSDEAVSICGLLHDLTKVNFYKTVQKRRLNTETGKWESYNGYAYDDRFPFGHGEKSVWYITQFMKLTDEEAISINWHMGAFDERVKGGSRSYDEAIGKYPLVFWLHTADQKASSIDERGWENS
mgnify:CR=1 FL=1